MRLALVLVLVAGCKSILGIEDPAQADGPADSALPIEDVMPLDGPSCVGSFARVCWTEEPPDTLASVTALSGDCAAPEMVGGTMACVVAAKTITVVVLTGYTSILGIDGAILMGPVSPPTYASAQLSAMPMSTSSGTAS